MDDLVDSGKTADSMINAYPGAYFDALYRKPTSPPHLASNSKTLQGWLVFPWEPMAAPADSIVRLLQWLGEDTSRDGIKKTPERVLKSFEEFTSGNKVDIPALLSTRFDLDRATTGPVVVAGIDFVSMCEHHLLPFIGHATVAYQPTTQVIGLSQIPRLVRAFAQRLQLQEQLTLQIAETLAEALEAETAVVITAQHMCAQLRGVKSQGSMVTSHTANSQNHNVIGWATAQHPETSSH